MNNIFRLVLPKIIISILITIGFLASACSKKEMVCGQEATIKANSDLISKWIDGVADAFEGAKFEPTGGANGGPAILFPDDPGLIEQLKGEISLSSLFGMGADTARETAKEYISCKPEDVCDICPERPEIRFCCGDDCQESDVLLCSSAADQCFDALLKAAAASHKGFRYRASYVRSALNEEFLKNEFCLVLGGLHAKCDPPSSDAQCVEPTVTPTITPTSTTVETNTPAPQGLSTSRGNWGYIDPTLLERTNLSR